MKLENSIFCKKVIQILKGWKLWRYYIKKYSIKDNMVLVLMPSQDKDLNNYALLYLDQFIKMKKCISAIVLVTNDETKELVFQLSRSVEDVGKIELKDAQCLMNFYCASNPDKRLIVIDIDNIGNRNIVNRIISVNNTTKEDLIVYGIFGLKSKILV